MTLDCERSLGLLYDFLDGELNETTHEQVAAHLEKCRRCYPYFNFQRLFLDRMASLSDEAPASAELVVRIRRLLDEERGT